MRSRETTLKTVTESETENTCKNHVKTVMLGVHSLHTDKNCLYTNVQFKEINCRFLIDTGSPVSIISYVDFLNLDLEETSLQSMDTNLISVDGNNLDVKGQITLEFNIGSCKFEQDFVVSDLAHLSGILGMDFLEKYNGEIQIYKQTLKTNQGKVELLKQRTYNCAHVRVKTQVIIPAESEKFIECKTDKDLAENIGIVESNKQIANKGLFIAKSLVKTNKDTIVLSVLNLSKKDVSLKPESMVGTVSAVVTVVNENETDLSIK